MTCGETIRFNGTYFRNPGAPAPFSDSRACSVTVLRPQQNICQLRLDFLKFDLDRPRSGVCENDRFVVSGQASNSIIPAICGYNTGQHMYIDVDPNNLGPVTLNVITIGSRPRLFDIRVTYIHCASPYKGKFLLSVWDTTQDQSNIRLRINFSKHQPHRIASSTKIL